MALGVGACLSLGACAAEDDLDPAAGEAAFDDEADSMADVDAGEVDASDEEDRIYGGGPVNSCGWPTTVSLGGSCTGTLIDEQVVIYAAHCGTNFSSVRFGDDISGGNDGFSVATQFCRAFPGFSGVGNGVDFAYCRLAQPVTNYPIVPPLMGCETSILQPGQPVTVVGFGFADNGPYGIKREVTTQLNGITGNNEAFVGGNGKDSCQGDSGGPVFVQLPDQSWRVFGITSYGGACGSGGFYSMMHIGMPWFEADSGIDLTPCHDAQGNWDPGPECTGFPVQPWLGGGGWPSCSTGAISGASSTCGPAFDGSTVDPDPGPGPGPGANSCAGSCGAQATGGCYCDAACVANGDCCSDFVEVCVAANSCLGRCGGEAPAGCFCDPQCSQFGDCCPDFANAC